MKLADEAAPAHSIGVVAIGRNEGKRLRDCLTSTAGRAACVVYVDSGSTDGSVELARSLGAEVVELDLSVPFTAARARNAGFARLREIAPAAEFVQFVDGDCVVRDGWLAAAAEQLRSDARLAVVCGRRRERNPQASVFNQLCDWEWDTPIGEAKACGGDALMRITAFAQVGCFDERLIAGEEPELCVRLRSAGWKIRRMNVEMTWHDAAMTRYAQWWKRNVRAGHAYAEGAALHGRPPENHWVRETRSNWFWGLVMPALALGFAWPTRGLSLSLLLAAYSVLGVRIARHARRRGFAMRDACTLAFFTVVGKLPNAIGQLQYCWNRLRGRRARLIEYKGAGA